MYSRLKYNCYTVNKIEQYRIAVCKFVVSVKGDSINMPLHITVIQPVSYIYRSSYVSYWVQRCNRMTYMSVKSYIICVEVYYIAIKPEKITF